MRKLVLLIALAFGLALVGPGASSEAQARPHGWHQKHGQHQNWRYYPRRHYGWQRGRQLGWHKPRKPRYLYGERW
ncbi:hypothetical protein DWF00_10105 [Bosea caraganae]|uniref:Sulfur globule protein n=1 Tax=Bosea caraganae TaxID=2763117 RepID=A0A370LBV4_9HYPH|nr:hypothetical protein [Bosea caraganae]RDJ27313.1 hypothetical protein DWF00_10105 [Bosea caraganae]RDJ29329.1 hypothetical protein DWE98_01875 [Bosea caraganae]